MRLLPVALAGSLGLAQAFLAPTTPSTSLRLRSDAPLPSTFLPRGRKTTVDMATLSPPPVKSDSSTGGAPSQKRVYLFREGKKEDKLLLGGKGANLAEMTNIGLPVPPGFTICTDVCREFFENGQDLPAGVLEEYLAAIKDIERATGREYGNPKNPLLFSVRSGAAVSMPGMMNTLLGVGINDEIAEALGKMSNNPRWAYDTYRRFIQMFGDVVLNVDHHRFEEILTEAKKAKGVTMDTELTAEDWKVIIAQYKTFVDVPQDPHTQLLMAIKAVFTSWYTPRAKRYRQFNGISDKLGTAANIQSMVFGNMGEDSGTGVMFTRNPSTGANENFGEFLINAAGEDVVAGIRTPVDLKIMSKRQPEIYKELMDVNDMLERHYRDMQDIEFTVQEGKLYILQCRSGKRTAKAAVKMAVDMVKEGLINKEEALLRVDARQMDFFLHPTVDPKAKKTVIAKGLPASPGVGTGELVFNSDEAEALWKEGKKVVLVRKETTAEDIHGMKAAEGILTEQGGMTSHAAVVARGMGKCCVSGCQEIEVNNKKETVTLANGRVLRKGDIITIDGSKGEVIDGTVDMVQATSDPDFQTVLEWADAIRTMSVKANADTPEDARKGRELGAEGIGLCRTEHMFFDPARIDVVRQMILAATLEERKAALDKLFVFQRDDMREIFKAMSGFPVTIRLLDPPLHEFLPHEEADMRALAKRIGKDYDEVAAQIKGLEETNPMLGFRGCRLSVVYPEITDMQVRAVITGAIEAREQGFDPKPEIMVPLVGMKQELELIAPMIEDVAEATMKKLGKRIDYKVGTMLELPRACVMADRFAPMVEFMSFGTNDLTQATYGFSRDDIGSFLPAYLDKKVLEADPFATLDQKGVGFLMRQAVQVCRDGRFADRNIKFGICGEHGGDPASIKFVQSIGLDYTSCSPFRVPIARIAAAQAAIDPYSETSE
jgi:pyruvate, orthophosphate dikinase